VDCPGVYAVQKEVTEGKKQNSILDEIGTIGKKRTSAGHFDSKIKY